MKLIKQFTSDFIWTRGVTDKNYPNKVFLLEQFGKIYAFDTFTKHIKLFFNISDKIQALIKKNPWPESFKPFSEERGLLGMTFDPNHHINGKFYLLYTGLPKAISKLKWKIPINAPHDNDTIVSQFNSFNNYEIARRLEKEIITFPSPHPNHNGGEITFHKGYLFIGIGDGGSKNDLHGTFKIDQTANNDNGLLGYAQDLSKPFGKMLRIDVSTIPYKIPKDNPFIGKKDPITGMNALGEIYAYGFRNPWNFSFNKETLYVADVGQNNWEKVSIVKRGENHGWRAYEGKHVFRPLVANALNNKVILPILEYPHKKNKTDLNLIDQNVKNLSRETGYAVIGGFVYKGIIDSLRNKYIFADYSGKIFWVDNTYRFKRFLSLPEPFPKNSIHNLIEINNEIYVIGRNSIYKIINNDNINKNISNMEKSLIPRTGGNTVHIEFPCITFEEVCEIFKRADKSTKIIMSSFRKNKKYEPLAVRMWVTIVYINEGGETEIITLNQSDAWDMSKNISIGKAMTAFSLSSNQNAITTRALGTLTQPGSPLWNIGSSNPGFSIIEFAGGIPLYRKICNKWFKVGAIGISGDSIDNDEAVALAATKGFQAPLFMRSTPYTK